MKQKPFTARQGDVLIERISKLPQNLTPIARENGSVVLAHGEATGHSHAIMDTGAILYAPEKEGADTASYLEIVDALNLVHEEHATIPLAKGAYRVTRQREYHPEAIRNVAD